MLRDDNSQVHFTMDSYNVVKAEPGAFIGGTAQARGDQDGASNPTTLYTVTGDVVVRVFGVCTTDLAGATATLEVGVAGNTASLIAQTTATDIDAGELWHDASPDSGVEAVSVAPAFFIANGADIIETVGTANITSGALYYICLWRPVSPNGNVVAA